MRKFYCQYCGSEVPLNAHSCPNCEREFGSVLCPKCSYRGSANRFVNGCPKCGYLRDIIDDTPETVKKRFNLTFKLFVILGTVLVFSIIAMIKLLLS